MEHATLPPDVAEGTMSDPQVAEAARPSPKRRRHLVLVAVTVLLWSMVLLRLLGRGSPLLILALLAVYLVAAAVSSIPRYLLRLGSGDDVAQYIARLRAAPPAIVVFWRCWRDETRPQLVTQPQWRNEVGPGGRIRQVSRMETRTEYRQTMVVLGEGNERFPVPHWQDASPEVTRTLFASPIMSIDFDVTVEVDSTTATALAAFKDEVRARHARADALFTMSESRGVDGFKAKGLAVVDRTARPALLTFGAYLVATALGLAGLYALWFDRAAGYGRYVFVKRVTA
jgi:hypothetical protein